MKIQGDRNNFRKNFAPLFLNMSLTHSTTLNILLNCFDEAMMSLHCFIEHDRFFAAKFAFCCITQELPYRPGFENGLVLILFFSLQVCIRISNRVLKIPILVCSILENVCLITCSWHQKTNSPILQLTNLKCCIKAKEPFKTPF